jgi:predicted  nucleic acid-binding Zn-ribbon protein
MKRSTATRDLVRCLDCGTEYDLEIDDEGARPCPACGGVGWIEVPDRASEEDDS